jgi:ParB-like nuclease domain
MNREGYRWRCGEVLPGSQRELLRQSGAQPHRKPKVRFQWMTLERAFFVARSVIHKTRMSSMKKKPAAAASRGMKISTIKVGKRFRKDMGDLAGLAESIEDIGLLNPVTVDEDGHLLAGARRLAACKRLGWKIIPVTVTSSK